MIILGLDTTNRYCTAALVDDAVVLASQSRDIGRGHAEALAPMVRSVLDAAQISPGSIDRIAVCTGPGSFTGLRVALSFAKAFALPRALPVIGISALEVMAAEADPERAQTIIAASDVRRGELCWAAYAYGLEIKSPVTQDVDSAKAEIAALGADRIVGDGAALAGFDPSAIDHVNGAILAWLGAKRSRVTHPATPLYSRPPDAKLPGGLSLPA